MRNLTNAINWSIQKPLPSKRLTVLAAAMLTLIALITAWFEFRPPVNFQDSQPRASASEPSRNALSISLATRPHQIDSGLIGTPRPGLRVTYHIRAEKFLNYGRAEAEIGMLRENGQTAVGPESFAIGKDGSILVGDLVNQRVLLYSNDGNLLSSFELPGVVLNDIAVDAKGNVYAYDHMHSTLSQYNMQGAPQGVLQINPATIDTRGYLHVVDDSIYLAEAAARDALIGTLVNGLLTAADTSFERVAEGVQGDSGRVYSLGLVRREAFKVLARDSLASQTTLQLQVSFPGIVSATFVGEDANRCFYIQTERLVGDSVVLEVCVLSATGELLAVTRMPENDYALWTTKLVAVAPNGEIVQFLPQRNHAKLSIFSR